MTTDLVSETATTDHAEAYRGAFERILESAGKPQAWLRPVRNAAFAQFAELGFPTTRDEEWRYTNVGPIADGTFEPARGIDASIEPGALEPFLTGSPEEHRLVFVNGRFVPQLSCENELPGGVVTISLEAALRNANAALQAHLTRYAKVDGHPFTALNTALMEDGAFVHVPKGCVAAAPIHLIHVGACGDRPAACHPRNLILLEPNSQARVIESYVALDGGACFTNVVTEIVAKDGAVLDHGKIARESRRGLHISTQQIHQARSSNVSSHTVTFGGRLVRNDINARLDGEGCECTLNGLYMARDGEHVDNHLVVDHAQPHGDSREFFKGILDGTGKGVFSGRIIVREGAQKTDAKQTNQSLLLSADAQVESKPQLEIFADDVKCTHGATIGQVSADALFYLRSRGLSESAARSLLIYAFARQSVEKITLEPLRRRLSDLLFDRLPHSQLLREVV